MNADELLTRVLDADRAVREARENFISESDTAALLKAAGTRVTEAMAQGDAMEAGMQLMCIADLLVDLGGVEGARLLVTILGHEEPAVRAAAGDSLLELMYDRFAEVARVIEAEVDRGPQGNAIALAEVPFLFAEVGEAGGVKIVSKLLKHPDADVVGAAVEGLAALGDASVLRLLEPLRKDKRKVTVEDDSDGLGEVTVGDLADEAITHLRAQKGF